MPAFTFEKISAPIPANGNVAPALGQSAANVPAAKKPSGVMVQIFGRLVETRADRAQRVEQSIARRDPKQG
jgi:hypothetical protein